VPRNIEALWNSYDELADLVENQREDIKHLKDLLVEHEGSIREENSFRTGRSRFAATQEPRMLAEHEAAH
jgi:hypothetical protein